MKNIFLLESFSARRITTKALVIFFVTSLIISPALAAIPTRGVSIVTRTPATTVPTTPPTPTTGYLAVESTPSGAQVSVNGVSSGVTPLVLSGVSPGSYSVVVSIAGYEPESDMVSVTAGQRTKVSFTLEPIKATSPPATSPITVPITKTVVVGQTTIPSIQIGNILVGGSPAGALVALDGNEVGKLPAEGKKLILEKIIAGKHTLMVSQAGYTSKTADVTVPDGGNVTVTLDLQKVEIATPGQVTLVTPPPTTTPTRKTYGEIQIKGKTFRPVLSSVSPDFITLSSLSPEMPIITSFLQVDRKNIWLDYKLSLGKGISYPPPEWSDQTSICVMTGNPKDVYLRWISDNPQVDAVLWQVSRYPFPSVKTEWKNQELPGLVGSGYADDLEVDSEGFHYFKVNISRAADRNPAYPPYFEGIATLGKPAENIVKIPLGITSIFIKTKKIDIGPISISVPVGLVSKGAETSTGFNHPIKECPYCRDTKERKATPLEKTLLELPQTFYIRIVPFANGNPGVPSLPIKVTVKRPGPCPLFTPKSGDTLNLVTRPPSVEVIYYDPPRYLTDWNALSRAQFTPPVKHYKIFIEKKEKCNPIDWTSWDICGEKALAALDDALSTVSNAVSTTWEEIKKGVVYIAATIITGVTGGIVDCSDPNSKFSNYCNQALYGGLTAVMIAYGVPPTLPNYAELQQSGKEYFIKSAMDQIGAGEAYDLLPPDIKNEIKDQSEDIAKSVVQTFFDETTKTQLAAIGNKPVPDPWYAPHPGVIMVRVFNPNNEPTDPAVIRNAIPIFSSRDIPVPSLQPGEQIFVPIVLEEKFPEELIVKCKGTPSEFAFLSNLGADIPPQMCIGMLFEEYYLEHYYEAGVAVSVKAPLNDWDYEPYIPGDEVGVKTIAEADKWLFLFESECGTICGMTTWKETTTLQVSHPPGWIYKNTPYTQEESLAFRDCDRLFCTFSWKYCPCATNEGCGAAYMSTNTSFKSCFP